MTRDEYMERQHHITETQIGLARLHLSVGDADKAQAALDLERLAYWKRIQEERYNAQGY